MVSFVKSAVNIHSKWQLKAGLEQKQQVSRSVFGQGMWRLVRNINIVGCTKMVKLNLIIRICKQRRCYASEVSVGNQTMSPEI